VTFPLVLELLHNYRELVLLTDPWHWGRSRAHRGRNGGCTGEPLPRAAFGQPTWVPTKDWRVDVGEKQRAEGLALVISVV